MDPDDTSIVIETAKSPSPHTPDDPEKGKPSDTEAERGSSRERGRSGSRPKERRFRVFISEAYIVDFSS